MSLVNSGSSRCVNCCSMKRRRWTAASLSPQGGICSPSMNTALVYLNTRQLFTKLKWETFGNSILINYTLGTGLRRLFGFLNVRRAYEEVCWDSKLPCRLRAPETSLGKVADPVSERPSRRRCAGRPQLWQVSLEGRTVRKNKYISRPRLMLRWVFITAVDPEVHACCLPTEINLSQQMDARSEVSWAAVQPVALRICSYAVHFVATPFIYR